MRRPTLTGTKLTLSSHIGFPVVLGFVLLAGCTSSGLSTSGSPSPTTAVVTDGGPCQEPSGTATDTIDRSGQPPNLESVLYRLVSAENRTAYAADRDLTLRDDGVRVVIELQSGTEVPPEFDVTVETRYENLVQSFVPVCELVALSEHGNVSFVRSPQRLVTGEPSSNMTDT